MILSFSWLMSGSGSVSAHIRFVHPRYARSLYLRYTVHERAFVFQVDYFYFCVHVFTSQPPKVLHKNTKRFWDYYLKKNPTMKAIPVDERKKIAGLYRKLREAARTKSSADCAREEFTSRMGRDSTEPPLTAHEVAEMVKVVVKRSKLRAHHRSLVNQDLKCLQDYTALKDNTALSIAEVPSEIIGPLSVNFIGACEGAAADAEEELHTFDKEITTHLAVYNAQPDAYLNMELGYYTANSGVSHALCVVGQPLSKVTRGRLVTSLEAQNVLRLVYLHDCGLRDEELRLMLPTLAGMQHLRVLCLPGNLLSHITVARLSAELEKAHAFPSLQVLDISGNGIPHSEAKHMQKEVSERFARRNKTFKTDPWLSRELQRSQEPRVLCLDGGAARCIVEVQILIELEKRSGKPLDDVFDLVVGSGFGALIAVGIRLKKNLTEILDLLLLICQEVFSTQDYTLPWVFEAGYRKARSTAFGNWYPGTLLHHYIAEFTAKAAMKDVVKPLQIVASRHIDYTTSCSIKSLEGREVCFRSYATSVILPYGVYSADLDLATVCCASCSTPGYFAAVEVPGVGMCVDGGVSHANPSLLVLTELLQQTPVQSIVLVSVGSGIAAGPTAASYSSLYEALSQHAGDPTAPSFASPQKPHSCLNALEAMKVLRYFRYDPAPARPLLFDYSTMPHDECKTETLQLAITATKDWMESEEFSGFDELVEMLK